MPHTVNGNRNPLNRSRTNDAKKSRVPRVSDMKHVDVPTQTPLPTSTNPKSLLKSPEKNSSPQVGMAQKRAERTSVGRVINGWKVVAKVRKSEIGKFPHPIYRGICPVCGKEKDQELAYFRNSMSCGCAQYKRKNPPEISEQEQEQEQEQTTSQLHEKPRRKQGARKPGVLVRYADMPENQQIMLSECLGSTWNAMQNVVGDRFLLMLDAFQGDDVQMPTVEQIEKRIIMAKIASEFTRLRVDNDEDQSIDHILGDMADAHKTSPDTIMEILRLASIELQNAHSEHAFQLLKNL